MSVEPLDLTNVSETRHESRRSSKHKLH